MVARFDVNDIGGGRLRRGQRFDNVFHKAGTQFTGEQLRSMVKSLNLRSMIDNGILQTWPKAAGHVAVAAAQAQGERLFSVHTGFGQFRVIRGVEVASKLTKEEADAMLAAAESPKN